MISLYGFNEKTQRFTIEVTGIDYTFSYDPATYRASNFRRADDNSLVAKTYKGFRDRLGILSGSQAAQKLIDEIRKAADVLKEREYKLKKRATSSVTDQAGLKIMTWVHDSNTFAAMVIRFDLADLLKDDPIYYGATREAAISACVNALRVLETV